MRHDEIIRLRLSNLTEKPRRLREFSSGLGFTLEAKISDGLHALIDKRHLAKFIRRTIDEPQTIAFFVVKKLSRTDVRMNPFLSGGIFGDEFIAFFGRQNQIASVARLTSPNHVGDVVNRRAQRVKVSVLAGSREELREVVAIKFGDLDLDITAAARVEKFNHQPLQSIKMLVPFVLDKIFVDRKPLHYSI